MLPSKLETTAIPDDTLLDSVFPPKSRLLRGKVAIIECFEEIPCNPCADSCPMGAIAPFQAITDLPKIDHEACTGCGLCISKCPGLAIMTVDFSYSRTHALMYLPYEFLPLPEAGQRVLATDRAGVPVCDAEVISVQNTQRMDKTPVVCISVEVIHARQVRGFVIAPESDAIVCRCADLTESEICALIDAGHRSIDELKRVARLGMGACAGRGCIGITMNILSRKLGVDVAKLSPGSFRPPTKPVLLSTIARGGIERD